MTNLLAPGARVVIRDAEWLVRKTDRTATGALALHCLGISEIVRDQKAIFLEDVEDNIEALDAVETRLVPDPSPGYKDGLLAEPAHPRILSGCHKTVFHQRRR